LLCLWSRVAILTDIRRLISDWRLRTGQPHPRPAGSGAEITHLRAGINGEGHTSSLELGQKGHVMAGWLPHIAIGASASADDTGASNHYRHE
jgi:hypothetical protein